ncbi:hypothetical protein AAMO2058_000424800 [Amorphochlora amoebiformis]
MEATLSDELKALHTFHAHELAANGQKQEVTASTSMVTEVGVVVESKALKAGDVLPCDPSVDSSVMSAELDALHMFHKIEVSANNSNKNAKTHATEK